MKLYKRLVKNKLSIYRVSQLSGIPYSTLNDLFNEKTSLLNASVETLYKLSKVFEVSMEELLSESIDIEFKRIEFDLFRSHIQHLYHDLKAEKFIDYIEKNNLIEKYFQKNWLEETLYLVAMIKYVKRINKFSVINKYEHYSNFKLSEPLYPKSIILKSTLNQDKTILDLSYKNSIVEFKQFNIVENEIENVA